MATMADGRQEVHRPCAEFDRPGDADSSSTGATDQPGWVNGFHAMKDAQNGHDFSGRQRGLRGSKLPVRLLQSELELDRHRDGLESRRPSAARRFHHAARIDRVEPPRVLRSVLGDPVFRISSRIASSSPDEVSTMPMPPAFDIADASFARASQPVGACTIGSSTPGISVMRCRVRRRTASARRRDCPARKAPARRRILSIACRSPGPVAGVSGFRRAIARADAGRR